MNTAFPPRLHNPDLATQIALAMRTMGISPIPRNYNLFYEAFIGTNPNLTRDLNALGKQATQEELDELTNRYFDFNQSSIFDRLHLRLEGDVTDLLGLLQNELQSLGHYTEVLNEAREKISTNNLTSIKLVRTLVERVAEATDRKIVHAQSTAKGFDQQSSEIQQVRKELDEYKRIANTDSLTRLSNRRAFDERLSAIYDSSIGLHMTGLVLLDIDHFKRINDTHGHPVGDKILASVAQLIKTTVRKDGFVARSGGEEFAIILDGNNPEEIMDICERIRSALHETPFRSSKSGTDYGQVTISIGFSMASRADGPGHLYSQADIALYHAKENGRNRVVMFEEGMQKDYMGKSWLIYKKT
jgi:diguanylate cyclase